MFKFTKMMRQMLFSRRDKRRKSGKYLVCVLSKMIKRAGRRGTKYFSYFFCVCFQTLKTPISWEQAELNQNLRFNVLAMQERTIPFLFLFILHTCHPTRPISYYPLIFHGFLTRTWKIFSFSRLQNFRSLAFNYNIFENTSYLSLILEFCFPYLS